MLIITHKMVLRTAEKGERVQEESRRAAGTYRR